MKTPRLPRPTAALRAAMLALACLTTAAAGQAPAQPLARLDAQTAGVSSYRLPNGFRIILAPFANAGSARIELLVRSGSKVEGYGETGMAHLLEHMLFKGAGRRTSVKNDLDAIGARWNGTTSADRTNYFETLAADAGKIDEAIRIEADRFIRARFTREDLASEMSVVRNELERADNEPFSVVMRALQRQSYFWHGYGRPTIGARSDIEDAPFAALQAFHRRHYRPDNAALIVSGQFDPARVLALASRLFAQARNPDSPPPSSWTREETRASTNRSELALAAGTTLVASGWKLPAATDAARLAAEVALAAVCDPNWGSLRKDLVLDRKIAVSASCFTRGESDYGLLVASARSEKDADAERLSRELGRHLEAAAARGLDAVQLERARVEQLNAYERLRSSHEEFAAQLSDAEVAGDWRLLFWQLDRIRAITTEQANEALKAYIVPANRSDVLLRHAEGATPPAFAAPADARALVAGRDWPVFAAEGDALPASLRDLARAMTAIDLGDARAALIRRRTQGDLAWISLRNDWGSLESLSGRQAACRIAGRLLAYGGGGLDRDRLDARMEALQARWSLDLDGIELEAPRGQLAEALQTLLGVWSQPLLPPDEFERARAAAIASIEAAQRNPAAVADNAMRLRFDNFPAGHPRQPLPLERQLAEARALQYADVQRCVADFGGIGRIRLGVAGDLSADEVRSLWSRVVQLPRARVGYQRIADPEAPQRVDTTAIEVALPDKPSATITGTAVIALRRTDADYPALRVAVEALGGGASSRIWHRVRETEGLAYSAGAALAHGPDARATFRIQASAASGQAGQALASLRDELDRALRDGFGAQEIARAKSDWLLKRRTALARENQYAAALAAGLLDGEDYAWLAEFDQRVAAVSAEQASAALRKYLGGDRLVWATGRGQ